MLKLSKRIVLNTSLLTFVLISFSFLSTGQNHEEIALQFFEDAEYTNALPYYQELNVLYPNDHSIQYYYGVCLTETNSFGNKARKLLLKASNGDVSPKVYFYIGKNYHAQNNFETALNYYNRFDEFAKKKDKKAVGFQEVIAKCNQLINPFGSSGDKTDDSVQINNTLNENNIDTINVTNLTSPVNDSILIQSDSQSQNKAAITTFDLFIESFSV